MTCLARLRAGLGSRRAGVVLLLVLWLALPVAADSPTSDADLRSEIESRLAPIADREGTDIRIAVQDGQVLLQGSVRLLEQSLRAEQAAWTTPGVIDVDNELRVARAALSADAAIEQKIRAAIKGDERFLDTNLEVEVRAGFVRLNGLFKDPGDVLALKHRVAAIAGVLDVEIDAVLVARIPASVLAPSKRMI